MKGLDWWVGKDGLKGSWELGWGLGAENSCEWICVGRSHA
jgi:hypothetical protein